ASGMVILSADAVVAHAEKHPNDPILLVRKETSPEDVAGMHLAKGILTSTGGKASHAAVVARGWGKPCVVGCEAVKINEANQTITVAGQTQKADFVGIFEAMAGLPVTIRLLDPPLHEFLPHDARGQEEVGKSIGVSPARIKERVEELHEFNPMMGFRGCRLPIVFPEIGDMQ